MVTASDLTYIIRSNPIPEVDTYSTIGPHKREIHTFLDFPYLGPWNRWKNKRNLHPGAFHATELLAWLCVKVSKAILRSLGDTSRQTEPHCGSTDSMLCLAMCGYSGVLGVKPSSVRGILLALCSGMAPGSIEEDYI